MAPQSLHRDHGQGDRAITSHQRGADHAPERVLVKRGQRIVVDLAVSAETTAQFMSAMDSLTGTYLQEQAAWPRRPPPPAPCRPLQVVLRCLLCWVANRDTIAAFSLPRNGFQSLLSVKLLRRFSRRQARISSKQRRDTVARSAETVNSVCDTSGVLTVPAHPSGTRGCLARIIREKKGEREIDETLLYRF